MGRFNARVDICQAAAMKVGSEDITSIENPVTVTESRLSFLYEQTKRYVLRSAVWNFAQRIVTLASCAETPPAGFTKVFALPPDNVRYLGLMINGELVTQATEDYMLADGKIYQRFITSDSLVIKYIRDVHEVKKFDDLFIKAFVLALAYELAFVESQKSVLSDRLLKEYDLALMEAKSIDGQEQKPRRITRSRWATARRRGSISNSATLYLTGD